MSRRGICEMPDDAVGRDRLRGRLARIEDLRRQRDPEQPAADQLAVGDRAAAARDDAAADAETPRPGSAELLRRRARAGLAGGGARGSAPADRPGRSSSLPKVPPVSGVTFVSWRTKTSWSTFMSSSSATSRSSPVVEPWPSSTRPVLTRHGVVGEDGEVGVRLHRVGGASRRERARAPQRPARHRRPQRQPDDQRAAAPRRASAARAPPRADARPASAADDDEVELLRRRRSGRRTTARPSG